MINHAHEGTETKKDEPSSSAQSNNERRTHMKQNIDGERNRARRPILLSASAGILLGAALTGISESAVSHQLRRLKDLSLVRSRREGQVVYYALDDKHVVLMLDIGLRHVREK